jgi:hypothetical protein
MFDIAFHKTSNVSFRDLRESGVVADAEIAFCDRDGKTQSLRIDLADEADRLGDSRFEAADDYRNVPEIANAKRVESITIKRRKRGDNSWYTVLFRHEDGRSEVTLFLD